MLVQDEFGHEGEQNVAHGSGGQDVRQVSPRQRGHVGGKKSQEKRDAQQYPGIGERDQKLGQAGEPDVPDIFHAPRKGKVPAGGEYDYAGEDQVLTPVHDPA